MTHPPETPASTTPPPQSVQISKLLIAVLSPTPLIEYVTLPLTTALVYTMNPILDDVEYEI